MHLLLGFRGIHQFYAIQMTITCRIKRKHNLAFYNSKQFSKFSACCFYFPMFCLCDTKSRSMLVHHTLPQIHCSLSQRCRMKRTEDHHPRERCMYIQCTFVPSGYFLALSFAVILTGRCELFFPVEYTTGVLAINLLRES